MIAYLKSTLVLIATSFMLVPTIANDYPIDGYDETGIRRLKYLEMIAAGELTGNLPAIGGRKSVDEIHLNLLGNRGDSLEKLPAVNPKFQASINALFPRLDESYSISILDITPGKPIRYAGRKEKGQYQPGSVGKLAILYGFFNELKKIYPRLFSESQELLRTKAVRGGKWAMVDEHTAPFFDTLTNKLTKRTIREDDVFTLYEWLDHMVSVSNNGAASVCWREAVLMRKFGRDYPTLTEEEAEAFFKSTPKSELSTMAVEVVNEPLRSLGITEDEWRLGSFFTRGASAYIPGKGGSIGSPAGLMKFLVAMERGKLVDMRTSLEIKRILYMTDRRIRYASAGVLSKAAVYFKSGSLYSCRPEEGYSCAKYKGNKDNFMNSVAIVEHPEGTTYMVVLMSNVLKKNSASDHAELAVGIDRIVKSLK